MRLQRPTDIRGAIRLSAVALALLVSCVVLTPAKTAAVELGWTDDLRIWTIDGTVMVKDSLGGTEIPPSGYDNFIFISNGGGAGPESTMSTTFEVLAGFDTVRLNLPYNFVSDEFPSTSPTSNFS